MLLSHKRRAKLYKFIKIKRLPYLPHILNIEPGNICNLKCPLCPTGSGDSSLNKGFLDVGLFKNIFDQLYASLETVNLYSWGEPLLNPQLGEIVRYIKRKKRSINVVTSTNLNIKDKKVLDNLISSGIDEIIVSCDGVTQDSYSRYRVGGDLSLVVENMKYLVSKKKEYGVKVRIVWNFLVFKHNENELGVAKKMAEEIGVEFRVGMMRTTMKDEILKPHSETIAKDKDWIPDNPEYSAYDKKKLVPKKQVKTCRKPWQEITVNWNGEVFPCCAVYGDAFSFADASKESVRIIWNNNKYIRAREEILKKNKESRTICGICRDNGFMHM